MPTVNDSRHAIRLEEEPWDDDRGRLRLTIDVKHTTSCKLWWGCPYRGDDTHEFHAADLFVNNQCAPYHHAHWRYDCPIGYLMDNVGPDETFFLTSFYLESDGNLPDVAYNVWKLVDNWYERGNLWLPIQFDFSYGWSQSTPDGGGEYDEDVYWEFRETPA